MTSGEELWRLDVPPIGRVDYFQTRPSSNKKLQRTTYMEIPSTCLMHHFSYLARKSHL